VGIILKAIIIPPKNVYMYNLNSSINIEESQKFDKVSFEKKSKTVVSVLVSDEISKLF